MSLKPTCRSQKLQTTSFMLHSLALKTSLSLNTQLLNNCTNRRPNTSHAERTRPSALQAQQDIGPVLTTFNYGLHLLAYFDAKTHALRSKALSLVTREATVTALAGAAAPGSSPFARLEAVVANARTTLRLFSLLPIYVKARKLMNSSKGMDRVLYVIAVVQCSLFATFQLLKNVEFLTQNGVLSKRGLGRLTGGVGRVATLGYPLQAGIFFWSNHIDKAEVTEKEAEKAAQWYYDWVRPPSMAADRVGAFWLDRGQARGTR
ncbi:hypothetical protein F5Y19DRAFT_470157 [Xylariaceae sp. FL1651]|nr:hypothetical protein F5Y19DRAFT_470157 [Xylariaceae sp. FL1651]